MKKQYKTYLIWIGIIVLFIFVFQTLQKPKTNEIPFTEFLKKALPDETKVLFIHVHGNKIYGKFKPDFKQGRTFQTTGDISPFKKELLEKGIEVKTVSAPIKDDPTSLKIKFIEFLRYALPQYDPNNSEVESIVVKGKEIKGRYKNSTGKGFDFVTRGDIKDFIKPLKDKGVLIVTEEPDQGTFWLSVLGTWLPMIILFAFFFFFIRQIQSGGGKAMSFGKSRARLLSKSRNKVTFDDVAGIGEAKEELKEIVEFLKNPSKFTKLGGRIPKGVLLMGPPGTGKTLLARAVAGEADVPFFSISGSEFVEMFVGVGASRVRDLFEQGKRNAPCIIFVDEIDAVGRQRGAGLGGGHDEREQTLNQLLVEMDGIESHKGVILISATNRPDVLDPALLRPGRFDRRIVIPMPDVKGREDILKIHTRKKPLAPDVDLNILARGTPGFSGADLENLVNEAALIAARKNKDSISMEDFEEAKDKILMGVARKNIIMSEEEKTNTAYHEAGHTLVAKKLPGADPIHKVTIIPRGRSLGLTQQLPESDRYNYTEDWARAQITILLAGRIAEELVFNKKTTGAGNDFQVATNLARKMVCEWGMSSLGPMTFGEKEEEIFLGREITRHKNISEATAVKIDKEVEKIIMECYNRGKKILEENIETLHRIGKALLKYETLTGKEIDKLIEGVPVEALKDENGLQDHKSLDFFENKNQDQQKLFSNEDKKDISNSTNSEYGENDQDRK